jgi:hypothetical protein
MASRAARCNNNIRFADANFGRIQSVVLSDIPAFARGSRAAAPACTTQSATICVAQVICHATYSIGACHISIVIR